MYFYAFSLFLLFVVVAGAGNTDLVPKVRGTCTKQSKYRRRDASACHQLNRVIRTNFLQKPVTPEHNPTIMCAARLLFITIWWLQHEVALP